MAEIIRLGEKITFDRIVFYGCSLTAGSELGNEKFLNEEFKKKFKISDIDSVKRKHTRKEFIEKYIDNTISLDDINKYSTELAWSNILSKKFDVECENRSVPGGNNQLSVFNINLDINQNNINHKDLIIVGISPFDRWMWQDQKGDVHKTICGWDHDWPSYNFYKEYHTHLYNSNQIFYETYLSIKYLDLLSKYLNNRILLQFLYKSWKIDDALSTQNKILGAEILNLKSIIDCNFSFDEIVKNWKDDVCGYGHPKEHHHKIMAEHIFKKLIEK